MSEEVFVHKTAEVDPRSSIGAGTRVWNNAQVREDAMIGRDCVISKDVYIDRNVVLGDYCKVQNGASIYHGCTLEDSVFIGPHVAFTNDRVPRVHHRRKWAVVKTHIGKGASIGANSTIVCGITIGEYAMIAAGSVVTKNVAPYSMVMGNPARHIYYVDEEGLPVDKANRRADSCGDVEETATGGVAK